MLSLLLALGICDICSTIGPTKQMPGCPSKFILVNCASMVDKRPITVVSLYQALKSLQLDNLQLIPQ